MPCPMCSPLTCIVYPSVRTDYTTEPICASLYSQWLRIHWDFSYLLSWEPDGSRHAFEEPFILQSQEAPMLSSSSFDCLSSPHNYSPMTIRLAGIKLFVYIMKLSWRSVSRLIKCPGNELRKHIRITSAYFFCVVRSFETVFLCLLRMVMQLLMWRWRERLC